MDICPECRLVWKSYKGLGSQTLFDHGRTVCVTPCGMCEGFSEQRNTFVRLGRPGCRPQGAGLVWKRAGRWSSGPISAPCSTGVLSVGQRGTRGLSVTYLPSSVSFRKSLKSSFYALASFGGVGGESPCSEVKASRCLDCSWPEMNHFV